MKKFTFLALTVILLFHFSNTNAQQKPSASTSGPAFRTCATDEVMHSLLSQDPMARQRYEAMQKMFDEKLAQIVNNRQQRVNAIITIPVVVHIGLPNPNLVTDATVFNQLDTLNWTYGDASLTDSLRTYTPFRTTYGRSEIRFCLAQRTPTNLPTNGIDRVVNSNIFSGAVHPSTQIPAWDPTKYLNIWVVQLSGGVLGFSYTPGAFTPSDPRNGFVNDYRAFGSGPSTSGGGYLFNGFNGGKTAVHEIGHYFNLFHPWSDASNAGSNPSCTLSDGCADTPPTNGPTFGCPPAPVLNTCSPSAPGVMWQNHMDYADDVCMVLFTQNQTTRMNSAVLTFPDRVGLTTSNGCVPLTLTANNASISAINTPPAGFVTCDPTIPLTVTLRNAGSNALTTVRITVTRNATTVQTFDWVGNLASLASVSVPLNAVPLALGANAIQICTSIPNGVADTEPANDCMTVNGTRGSGTALPLVEGFESATFPPVGWIRNNPDGGITWQRTTTGVEHSGTGKASVDHFNYLTTGQTDDLRTPPFAIGTADSLWVSFWGAYRGFPGFPFDQFQVMVSTDCGQSFQVVYNARNDTAFVAPDGASPTFGGGGYFPTNINEWKRKSIDLSGHIPSGNILVQFRAINQFGNNMHLDDINIDKKVFFNNDAGVIAINKPAGRVCTSSEAPEVVIKNYGKINLTSVRINYQVDATGPVTTFNWTGNLARNQTESVKLPIANLGAVGNHSINVFTTLPNNVTDEDPSNDGLVKPYNVSQVFALPGSVTEEFTSSTFPPVNWSIINPNGDITWVRNATIGNRNAGSAYFNDFANTTVDRYDDLAMPNYSYSNIDSIFLSFNLAHITKTLPGTTGSRLDTLTVLLSKDCGNTFTTVYKKYGEELQTVNDPNFQISMSNFVPLASQWRRDSVNLGKSLSATEPLFQIVFRFSGNMENNFYLDDVNIRSQVLPAKLKNDGFLILPNPFRNTFGVWHYQVPANLRYINVYNSVGQLVYSKKFPGGGEKYLQVDLGGRAAGIYTVNLGYEDSNRNVSVQVVKY
ncbi:MAG TPA: M43 family zinc metalloprotease [Chitinophagaceae bacterium]